MTLPTLYVYGSGITEIGWFVLGMGFTLITLFVNYVIHYISSQNKKEVKKK